MGRNVEDKEWGIDRWTYGKSDMGVWGEEGPWMTLRFLTWGLGYGAIHPYGDIRMRSKVGEENMMFAFADGSRWRHTGGRLYMGLEDKRKFELEHELVLKSTYYCLVC